MYGVMLQLPMPSLSELSSPILLTHPIAPRRERNSPENVYAHKRPRNAQERVIPSFNASTSKDVQPLIDPRHGEMDESYVDRPSPHPVHCH